ncbi:putative FAD/NAD(P)-binding domain protein [Tanacetum coccineum]
MENDEVLIIGAGICGLATALALHRKGIKSLVFEKSDSLRNITGAAIGIWQNGWRALDQLGVANTLRGTAAVIKRDRMVSLNGGRQQDTSIITRMEILSNYEEQPKSIKKPFNSVLDIAEQLKFLEKAFVAKETNLFMSEYVVKDVNRLVRSIKEKRDDEEKKREEKSDGVDL